jgi:hypothetical protein
MALDATMIEALETDADYSAGPQSRHGTTRPRTAPALPDAPSLLDSGPLYAGANVTRISDIRPAAQIVNDLTPQPATAAGPSVAPHLPSQIAPHTAMRLG